MPSQRKDFTITVTVVPPLTTPGVQRTLKYAGAGPGGTTKGARHHHVFRKCDLFFKSPDGDLLIHFKNPTNGNHQPFEAPYDVANPIVFAAKGDRTAPLMTKDNSAVGSSEYTAVVALHAGGPPWLIWDDPELEDGGGGGPQLKKKAAKKKATKKAEKVAKKKAE
jgi:hypothetical protein